MNKPLRALRSLRSADLTRDRLEAALDRCGLSSEKLVVLHTLVEADDPSASAELGRLLSKSTANKLIDRLEADGLVQYVSDKTNRSSMRAAITEVGRQRYRVGQALSELAWDLG